MHPLTNQFAEYCESHFNLQENETYCYQSLPICLIDCVYSLRAKYNSVTIPIVNRYADAYMHGNKNHPGDTISMFLQHIEERGGPQKFADEIFKNHQRLGGKNSVPKENVCHQLAQYLHYLHIDTLDDFQNFQSPELLEIVIRSVKGIGNAGTNYLFMLAGDSNRCKPDIHIHQCINDSCGRHIKDDECQTLFTDTVKCLNKKYPKLTVRTLDSIIWRKYQSK